MVNDSHSTKPSIPAWQLPMAKDPATSSQDKQTTLTAESSSPDSKALIEQAKEFLRVPSIRDAPREKKRAFLEEKGVSSEVIHDLLDAAAAAEPSSSNEGEKHLKTIHDSSSHSSPTEPDSSVSPTSSESEAETSPQPDRNAPPIITYPEFLMHRAKPPPLVTFARLASAVYALASVSTMAYGASQFLVQPMLQSLTSARHDLSAAALQNLDALNNKLEERVSHIPPIPSVRRGHHVSRPSRGDDACTTSDLDSIESDPTELFHRDVATQTSPGPRRSQSPSWPENHSDPHQQPLSPHSDGVHSESRDPTTIQSTRLTTLTQSLSSFLDNTNNTTTLLSTLSSCHSTLLQTQLNDSRQPPSSGHGQQPIDEAFKFKNEIRAVKGAMLGARSFPRGDMVGSGGGGGGGGGGGLSRGGTVG